MLTLRPEQLDALLRYVHSPSFEQEAFEHLGECFPEQVHALGSEATKDAIRHGIARSIVHGMYEPVDVLASLEVMFLLGRDFDTDDRLPWVREILRSDELQHPGARASHLTRATLQFLEELAAEEG